MIVKRVKTPMGSRIEPALDQSWYQLDRLRWWAAVATIDGGVHIEVEVSDYRVAGIRQFGYYNVRVGDSVSGPMSYSTAQTYITGASAGAEAVRNAPISETGERP